MLYSSVRSFQLLSGIRILFFAVCFFYSHAQAQRPRQNNTTSKQAASQQQSACENKKTAILQIHRFLEQAKEFRDLEAKVRATAELGSLLWQCDPAYAEAVSLELHQTLKSEIDKLQESSRATASSNLTAAGDNKDAISLSKLKYLDSYLLSRINLHSPALVKRLAKNEAVEWDDVSYYTVRTLLDEGDVKRAALELRRSIASDSSSGNMGLLVTLRRRDPTTADSLYLASLNTLAHRPLPTAREFAEAGVYLFVSNLANDNQSGMLVLSSVDGTFIPQFAMRHPAASDEVVKVYLSSVAALLAQPIESIGEKKARYALGRVLLPYIPQTETGLLAAFLRGVQRLAAEVTEGIKNDRAYQSLTNAAGQKWDNLDQQLEGIQRIPLTEQRDELCVMLAHSLYSSKLYEKALKVVKLMSLSETRDKLETFLKLAIAHQHLGQKQLPEAQQIAFSVVPGPERSVFWINLAQTLRTNGDDLGAAQFIVQAVADARRSIGSERPLLLLKAAGAIKATDPLFARQLLLEAFDNINTLEKWRSPKWEAEALAHRAILKFPLAGVKDISFTSVLGPFVKDDPKEIELAITELKSEQLRVEGFLMLAKQLLSNANQEMRTRPKANGLN
ncbi:MAG TPA: hypothetical protein VF791_24080 [Pyrinomonadaceae bacterium]